MRLSLSGPKTLPYPDDWFRSICCCTGSPSLLRERETTVKGGKACHILHANTINLGKSVRKVNQTSPEAAEGEGEGRIPEAGGGGFVASC